MKEHLKSAVGVKMAKTLSFRLEVWLDQNLHDPWLTLPRKTNYTEAKRKGGDFQLTEPRTIELFRENDPKRYVEEFRVVDTQKSSVLKPMKQIARSYFSQFICNIELGCC